jgi:hypothetical protein
LYTVHSDWFNGIEILQGTWQHGEKVGYCYPSGIEKSLCKWDIYVPLVTKELKSVKISLFIDTFVYSFIVGLFIDTFVCSFIVGLFYDAVLT